MYNKKSKVSAVFAIIAALLLVGIMILFPFLMSNTELEGAEVLVIIFAFILGFIPLYASAAPFVLVALIFGIKMLKEQSRKKLISFNVRMLITSLVLLPILTWSLITSSGLIAESSFGLFPVIYTIATALAYVGGIVAQIVTIAILRKSPEEVPTATEE